MILIILVLIPFATGLVLRIMGKRNKAAWILSSLTLPALVLFEEFALPYRGGGASMWPIAVVFSAFYGAISGGLGVFAAATYLKKRSKK